MINCDAQQAVLIQVPSYRVIILSSKTKKGNQSQSSNAGKQIEPNVSRAGW